MPTLKRDSWCKTLVGAFATRGRAEVLSVREACCVGRAAAVFSTISQIEAGTATPSVATAAKLYAWSPMDAFNQT